MVRALREDDSDHGELNFGQSAGLIDSIEPSADVVRRISAEAEALVLGVAGRLVRPNG